MINIAGYGKTGCARGDQGTESQLSGFQLSVVLSPPVYGALGVIGVSGTAGLTTLFYQESFKIFPGSNKR